MPRFNRHQAIWLGLLIVFSFTNIYYSSTVDEEQTFALNYLGNVAMTSYPVIVGSYKHGLVALPILIAMLGLCAAILLSFPYNFKTQIRSLIVHGRKIPRLLIFSLALVSTCVVAQTPAPTPRTIRVVMDNAYAPYSFQSDDGKLQGILIDQWQAWERKTGIKVEIQAMDWGEAVRRMRAGEFDVIDSIVETTDRKAYFDFTPPYTAIEASIYFRSDISGITDVASLKGFPVGAKTGDQHIDRLKANGITTVILFQNNEAIIEAAKQHKINVFVVDDPSALYLLNKAAIDEEFRHSAPIFRDDLRRAVRKGDAATLRTVSEGFAAIGPDELRQIEEKWFGSTLNRYARYLTYAGYAAAVALLLIGGLVGWNRMLRKRIAQRTAALGESERRFRQIAENIREVFWMSTGAFGDPQFTILYISPAYESVWGRTCESLYQNPHSFVDAIHPEDRARVAEVNQRDHEEFFEVEYRVVRPDGSMRWIRDRGFPIKDAAGRAYRVTGIAEDITERKQAEDALRKSEDRIRLIIDTIPTMAWSFRPDGVVDFLNQRWMNYTGLSLEQYVEDPIGPIHPDDVPRVLERWRVEMVVGEPYEEEMRLRRADGEYRWFLVRTVPLRDVEGKLVKWYGVSTDIEDRKVAEEKLRSTSKQLRALSARLQSAREEEGTRIARELHDELGAALTSLKWDLEAVAETISRVEDESQFRELRKKIESMMTLTDTTIGTVRRISSELRPIILDALGLTEAIEWQARQFQERTGIIVQCDCALENINLSREQTTTVFRISQEALTNILRHAQSTKVNIQLQEDDGKLILTISDNGRGITDEEKSGQRTLGLLGMRERAHLIGGRIDIAASSGKGTTVTLRFPIVHAGHTFEAGK